MKNKINEAHFNLVTMAIADCFRPIREKKNAIKLKGTRIKFARSKLVKIWCDCSDNFEYEKLKKLIINHNLK